MWLRRRKRIEEAKQKISEYANMATEQMNKAKTTDNISEFFSSWDSLEIYTQKIQEIQNMENIREEGIDEAIAEMAITLKNVKQDLIQSCLKRSYHSTVSYIDSYKDAAPKIKKEYPDIILSSPEEVADDWEKEILSYSDFYSDRTKNFSDSLILQVREKLHIVSNMEYIDSMEGHDFENWCANLLAKTGFTDIVVTKGSGDQGVDITATKEGVCYAIQCKCYSSKLGNTPIQEVYAGRKMYDCHVGVVMTNNYFTLGAIELAKKTGVLLWDRDKIKEMLEQAK